MGPHLPSKLELRQASRSDLEGLVGLYLENHRVQTSFVPEILREPSIEWQHAGLAGAITELLDRSDAAIFIAIVDGCAVGLADVFLIDEPAREGANPRRYAKVDNLVVSSTMRLGGIGRQLLIAAEGWARQRTVHEVSVKIWDRPGGPRPFYERMGYTTVSRWMAKTLD